MAKIMGLFEITGTYHKLSVDQIKVYGALPPFAKTVISPKLVVSLAFQQESTSANSKSHEVSQSIVIQVSTVHGGVDASITVTQYVPFGSPD